MSSPPQKCDTEFDATGRGDGKSAESAKDVAYTEAKKQAALLCGGECPMVKFVKYKSIDNIVNENDDEWECTLIVVFKCASQ